MQRVIVDPGTMEHGFAKPIVLATGPSGNEGVPWVAGSGKDAFVAWDALPSNDVQLVMMRGGRVLRRRSSLLHDAVVVAFQGLAGGGAEIVWSQYGRGFPPLEAALITPAGTIGRRVVIARPGGLDTAATEISINARGDLVLAYVHDDGHFTGPPNPPKAHGTARVVLSVCAPALHCSNPRGIGLGSTRPVCVNPAVAMTENGTAILVAAAQDAGAAGCSAPVGVWQSVSVHGRPFGPATRIVAAGDSPTAAPDGSSSAIAVLNPGFIPYQTLAWVTVSTFSNPVSLHRVPDPDVTNQAMVAANATGQFVLAWIHASSHHNAKLSLKSAVGTQTRLGRPRLLAPQSQPPQSIAAAINPRGEAVVIWNSFSSSGANGMHVAFYHSR